MRSTSPRDAGSSPFWVFDDVQVNVELVSAWLTITQPGDLDAYIQVLTRLAEHAVHGAAARAIITDVIEQPGAKS